MEDVLNGLLWIAGITGYLPVIAGALAPQKVGWKKELATLRPITRKIFLTYYGYVGGMILAWPTLTLLFRTEMLAGDPAALGIAALIALFWTARLVLDFCCFRSDMWPEGRVYRIGHILLNSLFVGLATTYWSLLLWHWIK